MALESFVISNFKYGLDTRRSELTSQPGTLQQLVDCHINQGGEIEKRKAFTLFSTVGPANGYGLEITSAGLVIFGTVAQGELNPVLPIGVGYIRCLHPDGVTQMAGIVSSCSIGGFAWCAAEFADGNIYGYYNGAIVFDFTNGLVLASLNTNAKIATEIVKEVNRTTQYTGGTVIGQPSQFTVTSEAGTSFIITETLDSTDGTLTNESVSSSQPGVAANPAAGQFTIVAGALNLTNSMYNSMWSVTVNGVEILGGSVVSDMTGPPAQNLGVAPAVPFLTTEGAMATAVAEQINTFQSNYQATAVNNTITLTAKSSAGSVPNGYVITTGCTGQVCIWNGPFTFGLVTGSTTFNIESLYLNGVNTIPLGAVNWDTTVSDTIADLAIAITTAGNIFYDPPTYFGTNYVAVAKGSTLYVSPLGTKSTDFPYSVVINVTSGGFVSAGTVQGLNAVIQPAVINRTRQQNDPTTATCFPVGGTPPYTWAWSGEAGETNGLSAAQPNAATTSFTDTLLSPGGGAGYFTCTITDSSVPPVVAVSNVLTVTFPPV